MKRTFWILLFLILIAANLLVYMISLQDNTDGRVEEGLTEGNVDNLLTIYYIIFSGAILVAIGFIIITLIRQNMQVYY